MHLMQIRIFHSYEAAMQLQRFMFAMHGLVSGWLPLQVGSQASEPGGRFLYAQVWPNCTAS